MSNDPEQIRREKWFAETVVHSGVEALPNLIEQRIGGKGQNRHAW